MSSSPRTIVVTGADSKYFSLLQDCLSSLTRFEQSSTLDVGVLDFGLTNEQREEISRMGATVKVPAVLLDVPDRLRTPGNLGYLTRPFINDYFLGYDAYIWMDADAWLQTWDAVDVLRQGAASTGLAIVHERDPAYRTRPRIRAWTAKHYLLGYGPVRGTRLLLSRQRVNNGFFCMLADAPHWTPWRDAMRAAIKRSGNALPHDQFSLNEIVLLDKHPATVLPSINNWICDHSIPMWDAERLLFCAPRPPFEPISLMHLAGSPAKHDIFDVSLVSGDQTFATGLRFRQRPLAPQA